MNLSEFLNQMLLISLLLLASYFTVDAGAVDCQVGQVLIKSRALDEFIASYSL